MSTELPPLDGINIYDAIIARIRALDEAWMKLFQYSTMKLGGEDCANSALLDLLRDQLRKEGVLP